MCAASRAIVDSIKSFWPKRRTLGAQLCYRTNFGICFATTSVETATIAIAWPINRWSSTTQRCNNNCWRITARCFRTGVDLDVGTKTRQGKMSSAIKTMICTCSTHTHTWLIRTGDCEMKSWIAHEAEARTEIDYNSFSRSLFISQSHQEFLLHCSFHLLRSHVCVCSMHFNAIFVFFFISHFLFQSNNSIFRLQNYKLFDLESCISTVTLEKLCELCKHIDAWLSSGREKVVVLQDRWVFFCWVLVSILVCGFQTVSRRWLEFMAAQKKREAKRKLKMFWLMAKIEWVNYAAANSFRRPLRFICTRIAKRALQYKSIAMQLKLVDCALETIEIVSRNWWFHI